MPKKRILGWLLAGLVAVPVLTLSVAEVSTRIYRRRAERLLHDLRQLQVGKSTFEDARAVIVGHGGEVETADRAGCSPAQCKFEVYLRYDPIPGRVWGWLAPIMSDGMRSRVLRAFSLFTYLGLQDWWTGGAVTVVGGIVTEIGYHVFVRCSGGWILGRSM